VDGKAEFLPFGNLRKLLNATVPTLFFLDDLGQAPQGVQAAAMQLLLAREINGQKISDYVSFAAATNRKEDRAGVSGILEPVKSRFVTIINVETNADDWLRWARRNGLPEELLMLIKWRPELLEKFKATADMTNSPARMQFITSRNCSRWASPMRSCQQPGAAEAADGLQLARGAVADWTRCRA
jgi:hypothetical protein